SGSGARARSPLRRGLAIAIPGVGLSLSPRGRSAAPGRRRAGMEPAPPPRREREPRDHPVSQGVRVKVVIPLAGKGTRLRPHTHVTPKPLLRVGDKPVMAYILDDLRALGVHEAVFITGHLKEKVEAYVGEEYPDFAARYVEQPVQNG